MTFTAIELSPGDAENVSDLLYLCGSIGGFETETSSGTVFVAVFRDAGAAREARRLVRERGIDVAPERTIENRDWNAAYRSRLAPFSAGGFLIDARDEPDPAPPVPSERCLHIPAAAAFGTGLHESTRGILRFLETDDLSGKSVLDVGCGTAILAIAAARQGALACVAFDVDPDAVFEARKNLVRNPTKARVAIFLGGIECLAGSFDRILANMIWEEVSPLLPAIASLLSPGGVVVLSGILDEREQDAIRGLRAVELEPRSIAKDGEWRTIAAAR